MNITYLIIGKIANEIHLILISVQESVLKKYNGKNGN